MTNCKLTPGMKFKIKRDCFCQGYLHEKRYYPRAGLRVKKLNSGDEVQFVKEWENLYGSYLRVIKDGICHDILMEDLGM